MQSQFYEIVARLQENSNIKNITALALVLCAQLLSPIIAIIIIKFFHLILGIKRKTTESAFYGPIKFYIVLLSFGAAIQFLNLTLGIINLYWKIFKILTILTIAKALGNSMAPDSSFFAKLENNTKFNRKSCIKFIFRKCFQRNYLYSCRIYDSFGSWL